MAATLAPILVPVAAIVAAFLLATRGTDLRLRRTVPVYTSIVAQEGRVISPGSESTVIDLQGAGQIEGLTVRFSGSGSSTNGYLVLYIDNPTTGIAISPFNVAFLFHNGSTIEVGRFARPFTLTIYNTANEVYGFSTTAPIRFSSSIKISFRNNASSSITVNYIIVISLER